MKKTWKCAEYTTNLVSDNGEGWVALELHKRVKENNLRAARVVFWDSEGQFSLEISADELPLTIVEELIAEAKLRINIG